MSDEIDNHDRNDVEAKPGNRDAVVSRPSAVRFRLGKPADFRRLARVHLACAEDQPGSFMLLLGPGFLREYYRVAASESHAVIVCALDSSGEIVGFVLGTLDASETVRSLRRHPVRLGLAACLSILRRPGLLRGMWLRWRSLAKGRQREDYVVAAGPRCTYWAMLPEGRVKMGAVRLLQTWLDVMRLLGARTISHEVDKENARSEQIHKLLGSRVVREMVTPDGKQRLVMQYNFTEET